MKIHKRFFSLIFPGWEFGAQNKHESFIELLVHESKWESTTQQESWREATDLYGFQLTGCLQSSELNIPT